VASVEVGADRPPPQLIWGCAAARARSLRGLGAHDDPGEYFRSLSATLPIAGVILSQTYIDIGTPQGLRHALASPRLR
jgi:hypothetical protein